MALDYIGLLADLRFESDRLIEHLAPLTSVQWDLPTPALGWSIKDQVSHLAFFDDSTYLSLTHPDEFRIEAADLVAGGMDFPDRIAARHRVLTASTLLDWFVDSRRQLSAGFAGEDPKRRLPWFGPDMSVASAATARLMETWAHGQDIYDTIGVTHPTSPGLRSIAHLGVATFGFAHSLNGLIVPDDPVRIELRSPTDDLWVWGPADAAQRVTGPATDFVLTVTQRRHWTETALTAEGAVAAGWLDIAQAFAGAPSRREAQAVQP
ncbi:TIGR03084 family metal-binding protein [Mycolicibacterium komossense]|uniref:TIGR03084 family protein n=1 Tax=Mycolicibacterium komossense TaxID=1779 RepID=A0ABT3CKF5_9MYCO|nr:TIGR03084 family metal-binding protein [Mycolicibacterium komossense]MCV7229980.1 TIGR03084 family protein [Mycolicibacterium komossense]